MRKEPTPTKEEIMKQNSILNEKLRVISNADENQRMEFSRIMGIACESNRYQTEKIAPSWDKIVFEIGKLTALVESVGVYARLEEAKQVNHKLSRENSIFEQRLRNKRGISEGEDTSPEWSF